MRHALPYVVIGMLFYGLGEYSAKAYANSLKLSWAAISILSYAATGAAFLPAIKVFNSLAVLSAVWAVASALVTLLIAIVLFHETLGARQIAGVAMGIAAIVLLSE
jgi:multidrug transporter EmrE-like cation transporter